jgi:hypothetical protein
MTLGQFWVEIPAFRVTAKCYGKFLKDTAVQIRLITNTDKKKRRQLNYLETKSILQNPKE